MKRFLIITTSFLVLAILAIIFVFVLVSVSIAPTTPPTVQNEPAATSVTTEAALDDVASTSTIESRIGVSTTPESITEPVDIPASALSEGQAAILESVGVDTTNVTITPAQISCAQERLSAARIEEIMAGDTPTVLEIARLMPCLVVE